MNNEKKNTFGEKATGFFRSLVHPNGSRRGTAAAGSIAIVIVLVLFVNLILGTLDSSAFDFDLSDQSIYEISDASRTMAAGIDANIEFLMVAVEEEIDTRISKFVQRYAELNDNFSVSVLDPVANPSVLDTYECQEGDIVVKNDDTGKFTTVPMAGTTSGAVIVSSLDYSTYSYVEAYFDGDGVLTSAVNYVTSEVTNTVYCLAGHDEAALSDSVKSLISKANITLGDDVNILLDGGIPEDCDTLIINDPATDLAVDEMAVLKQYMRTGGTMILLLDDATLTNFQSFLNDYGMEVLEGNVGDQSRYFSQYYNTYGYFATAPVISEESLITMDLAEGTAMVMYPFACATLEDAPTMMTYETLLSTSDSGIRYIPVEGEDTEYETEVGTFAEAIAATIVLEDNPADNTANLTLISCPYIIDANVTDTFPNMQNLDLFMSILKENLSDVSDFDIAAKSLTTTYVTIENAPLLMVLYIGILPVVIFVSGIVIWVRRRKK